MATPLAPLKFRIAYLNSPTPKTLLFVRKSPRSLRRTEVCAILAYFCPKFGCHGNFLGSLEILDSVFEFADPENPTIHAKIMSISCTQMKLFQFECLASVLLQV